jgi:hypothetical protein
VCSKSSIRRRFVARTAWTALPLAALALPACAPQSAAHDELLGVDGLESPAVPIAAQSYKPAHWATFGESDRAAAFYVSAALASPRHVQIRLADSAAGTPVDFVSIATPADADTNAPPVASAAAVAQLEAGTPVFWSVPTTASAAGARRYALLIPEQRLSAFTRVDVFSRVADDGSAVVPVSIELVRDFFYLAVIGDSVQWGNGLKEADKMSALATAAIEAETGRKVIMQRYAHSGAKIVPAATDGVCEYSCFGEVPYVSTSILRQAEQIQHPELMELILMDGCINDVGVSRILNPLVAEDDLTAATVQFCNTEMAALLHHVRALAPQAYIVVGGYYQIVSDESDPLGLRVWQQAQGAEVLDSETDAELLAALSNRAALFHETCHAALTAAIATVNAEADSARIAFADPQLEPENAVFAPQPWLWSMTETPTIAISEAEGLLLYPEDPLAPVRAGMCFSGLAIDSALTCLYVSVGHPNVRGAQAYAAAIIANLRALGILPVE